MIFNNHDKGILDEATAIVGSSRMLVHENTEYFPELVINHFNLALTKPIAC